MEAAHGDGLSLKSPEGFHALLSLKRIGPAKAFDLAEQFATWGDLVEHADGFRDAELPPMLYVRQGPWRDQVRTVIAWDEDYPRGLREVRRRLPRLFVVGWLPEAPMVAVIGSRGVSERGLAAATEVSRAEIDAGRIVISGMARGVDRAAHEAALAAGAPTVAVVTRAFDKLSEEEVDFARKILSGGGALITLIAPGETPHSKAAPLIRNQVVAGLAERVIVAAAGTTGGTMKTVGHAVWLGRQLLAWHPPGEVGREPDFEGNRMLLSEELPDAEDLKKHMGLTKSVAEQALETARERSAGLAELWTAEPRTSREPAEGAGPESEQSTTPRSLSSGPDVQACGCWDRHD